LGQTTTETEPALEPKSRVTVTTDPGSEAFDPHNIYYPVDFTTSWTSSPASRTVPGKTLLVGDSFTIRAMGSLQPLFHKGTFLWIQPWMTGPIAAAIPKAKTIVFEVAEMFVPGNILAAPAMQAAVRKALRAADH
jgi:hypothetical protein